MGIRYATNVERLRRRVTGSVIRDGVEPEVKPEPVKPVKAKKAPRRSPKPKPVPPTGPAKPAEGHTAALNRLGEVRTLVLAKGDRFPKNPKRFDQVIDEKGDAWVFDLPRNEDGEWMTEGEGGEDLLMDWFPRVEEAPGADSERSEETE